MIPYINMQLAVWGKWAVSRNSKGLGYPSTSPMFQQMKSSPEYESCPPCGVREYVHETDAAVQRLEAPDQALCVQFYQIGGSGVAIARRMGIAKRTMYDRLDALHRAVMGHLNDIAAGY